MNSESGINVKIFMLNNEKSEVYIGKSPVVNDSTGEFRAGECPFMMVRRTAADSTDSLFISVLEAVEGESMLEEIRQIDTNGDDKEQICIQVCLKDGSTDTYLINLEADKITGNAPQAFHTFDEKYGLGGRVAVIKENGDNVNYWGVGAYSIRYNAETIMVNAGAYSGTVTSANNQENYFVVQEEVPEGDTLKGKQIFVMLPKVNIVPDLNGNCPSGITEQEGFSEAYEIECVRKIGGETRIYLNNSPFLQITNNVVVEDSRPFRSFEGRVTYKIYDDINGKKVWQE